MEVIQISSISAFPCRFTKPVISLPGFLRGSNVYDGGLALCICMWRSIEISKPSRKHTSKISLQAVVSPDAAFLHPTPGKSKVGVVNDNVFLTKVN